MLVDEVTKMQCPDCGKNLRCKRKVLSVYGGSFYCDCGYTRGIVSHLGRSMFTVDPLPGDAAPVYAKEDWRDEQR
jgi:hypothetical protein